jgi:hypothetical protein
MTHPYSTWASRWRVRLGFGFAIAYVVVSRPTLRSLIAGGAAALFGLVLRGLAAGYIEKSHHLATAGPFAYTRNPLYLGSFLLGAGLVIASASWILALGFLLLFIGVYMPVMRSEETFLRQKFGGEFDVYARKVPLFLPVPGRRSRGVGHFRWLRYCTNREYHVPIGYIAMLLLLILKLVLQRHHIRVDL